MRISMKTINRISLGLMIALLFVPILARFVKIIIFYPILFVWLFSATMIDPRWISLKRSGIVYIVYICLLCFLVYATRNSSAFLSKILTIILISYSSLFIYSFYRKHLDIIRDYGWFLYLCLAAGLVTTIPGLIHYPMAARILATADPVYTRERELYQRIGIGGYDYIYSLVLYCIFMPAMTRHCSPRQKTVFRILFLAFLFCIILSGYTMAVLFALLFTAMSVYFTRRKKQNGGIMLIAILLIFVLWFAREPILTAIADLTDRLNVYYASTRIRQLLDATEGSGLESLERMRLYENGWINFTRSPLVGVMAGPTLLKSGHSEALYYLETFGLLGLPYHFKLFFTQRNNSLCVRERTVRICLICCQVFFVVFSFVNRTDVAYSVMWSIYFVLPILSLTLDDRASVPPFREDRTISDFGRKPKDNT